VRGVLEEGGRLALDRARWLGRRALLLGMPGEGDEPMNLRTEIIDGETWTEHPLRFWCRECRRLTHPARETMPEGDVQLATPRCWLCGDDYVCDACGAPVEVDQMGGASCAEDPAH
jgi:hypothetical protein